MSEDDAEPERREPLADLTARIEEREAAAETSAQGDVFAEEVFEELDHGDVWEAIDAEQTAGVESVAGGTDTAVVPKREFCERCRHFAEPPDAHCTHDGTAIAEFVDRTRVRVSSCPVVEARGLPTDTRTD